MSKGKEGEIYEGRREERAGGEESEVMEGRGKEGGEWRGKEKQEVMKDGEERGEGEGVRERRESDK